MRHDPDGSSVYYLTTAAAVNVARGPPERCDATEEADTKTEPMCIAGMRRRQNVDLPDLQANASGRRAEGP